MDKIKEEEIIYRKIFMKDESPKEEGTFDTDSGWAYFKNGQWSGLEDCSVPTYWFEPIRPSSLLSEKDKEIDDLTQCCDEYG